MVALFHGEEAKHAQVSIATAQASSRPLNLRG